MTKLVIFKIGQGSWQEGYPVSLQIAEDNDHHVVRLFSETAGHLPPISSLIDIYQSWQDSYQQIGNSNRLGAPSTQVTHISPTEAVHYCKQRAEALRGQMLLWYRSGNEAFRRIRERLLQDLDKTEPIRLLVQTNQPELLQLPWHLFFEEFLESYPQAEVALGFPDYSRMDQQLDAAPKVKVLVILGSSIGIDVTADEQVVMALPGAEPHCLKCPTRQEFHDCLWEQRWHILFFAGHSTSQPNPAEAKIQLNAQEWISLSELKHALCQAVQQGLRLAIFNSCDGLGLAQFLQDINLPQVIVMRETVPDSVAHAFLQHFLTAYAGGKSLYLSVREAREKLQGLEHLYPCATWLPVIVQNPAIFPPLWQDLALPQLQGADEPIATLRQKLLLANTLTELKNVLQEVEKLLGQQPDHPQLQLLQEQVIASIERKPENLSSMASHKNSGKGVLIGVSATLAFVILAFGAYLWFFRSSAVSRPIRDPQTGSCECPYDRDTLGRLCGAKSAYARPHGTKPVCYRED